MRLILGDEPRVVLDGGGSLRTRVDGPELWERIDKRVESVDRMCERCMSGEVVRGGLMVIFTPGDRSELVLPLICSVCGVIAIQRGAGSAPREFFLNMGRAPWND